MKDKLTVWATNYEIEDFISSDPISIPNRYRNDNELRNLEISALITSWLCFGQREKIIEVTDYIDYVIMTSKPIDYIYSQDWCVYKGNQDSLYRMFKYDDFYMLCHKLYEIYLQYESIEEFVNDSMKLTGKNIIETFKSVFGTINGFPNSKSKSACKKLNLFFRWMNRKGSIVDFGRWNLIDNKDLIIPLDTHVLKMANELGFTTQTNESYKLAVEITEKLKSIFPEDPMKGDFALFGYSVNKNTQTKKVSELSIQEVILTELFFTNTFKTLNEFWVKREDARSNAKRDNKKLSNHVIDELHELGYWEPGIFILVYTKIFNKNKVDLSRVKRDFISAVGNGISKQTIQQLIEYEKQSNN